MNFYLDTFSSYKMGHGSQKSNLLLDIQVLPVEVDFAFNKWLYAHCVPTFLRVAPGPLYYLGSTIQLSKGLLNYHDVTPK